MRGEEGVGDSLLVIKIQIVQEEVWLGIHIIGQYAYQLHPLAKANWWAGHPLKVASATVPPSTGSKCHCDSIIGRIISF